MAVTNILVVDDEQDICELIQAKFRKAIRDQKFAFLFAHNGKDALQVLETVPVIHIILTDLNMPEMDGLTLLKKLETFNGQVIVITAYGDHDRTRQAFHSGAFDFLNKPLDFADLELTLERALKHQAALHARIGELEQRNRDLERALSLAQARIQELEQ